jgi:LmbE family N-acetylglucosaminyl deacetylase
MQRDLGSLLGVFAHPDDETYTMAGIMHAAVRAGHRVSLITATRGEGGSWDHHTWPTEELGAIREAELRRGLAHLGVTEQCFLGYPDGGCADIDPEEALAQIEPIFRDVQPDSVLSFGPDGMTDHPDHKATCAWATEAFNRWAKPGARLYYATQTRAWADRFVPIFNRFNVFEGDTPPITAVEDLAINLRLDGDALERKLRAINEHVSQVQHMMDAFGEDIFRDGMRDETFRLGAEK